MAIKWYVVMMIGSPNQFNLTQVKMQFKMLDEVWYCKNMIKKHFIKPLEMTGGDEDNFKKADECNICNKKI